MFTSFEESKRDYVRLRNISGDALLNVIDYIYNDNVRLTEHNIESSLYASNFLQLNDLTAMCEQFLK